ncbi:cysteine-rich receptor-like protein kinase 3 [Quercus suber]|uniref:Cysteine-rich receptor-like protein kinase 3 n=1 Tax=Quercus suber TaxID=58331 RepID=A0AAW0K6J5_QUESU
MSYLLVLLLVLCLFVNPCLSDPRATEAALICTNNTASVPQHDTFLQNFFAAMDKVTPLIATQRHAAVVNGSTGDTPVYVFGECMKDLTNEDCGVCFAQCKTQIFWCKPFQRVNRGGRLFYDGCYLRYDDYYFFNETLSVEDKTVCGSQEFVGNGSVFSANVNQLVMNLTAEAPKFDGFSVGFVTNENVTVYGLAQCWEFVNGSDCEYCLASAVSNISSCTPKEEGRVLNAGCYLRYSTEKFYYNSTQPVRNGNQGSKLAIALTATSSALALLLVIATVVFIVRKNVLKRRRDGQVVAIKRLFFNTTQWVDHFFNEVNLISDIHHKNLVKLLGCSIAGPESLLVYEYVPNRSVHDYFSGYMAPEYVLRGKLTEKVDVYSFGVLVIEVVSGKRNNTFSQYSYTILQMVWNLHGIGRVCEAVDPALKGQFQEDEASRLLQIGLLCVQASAELRPSMSTVVKMLSDNHEIPQPTHPPFLNSSSAEIRQYIPSRTYNSQPVSGNHSKMHFTHSITISI